MSIGYARIAQATFRKLGSGYKIRLVIMDDGHTRDLVENVVASYAEAETIARAYAVKHGIPWDKVIVILNSRFSVARCTKVDRYMPLQRDRRSLGSAEGHERATWVRSGVPCWLVSDSPRCFPHQSCEYTPVTGFHGCL